MQIRSCVALLSAWNPPMLISDRYMQPLRWISQDAQELPVLRVHESPSCVVPELVRSTSQEAIVFVADRMPRQAHV